MKRYSHIVMFCVLALLAAVSCRKENTQAVEWKTELQAVKSNLVFLPGGGTGTLEVNTSSVSVTSDKSWCTASASGNVVTVSVNANTGPQSRYAKLTLTSGGESINASVIQYGEVFDGLEILDMEVPAEGDTYAYPYYTNLDVQVVFVFVTALGFAFHALDDTGSPVGDDVAAVHDFFSRLYHAGGI